MKIEPFTRKVLVIVAALAALMLFSQLVPFKITIRVILHEGAPRYR